MLTYSGWIPGFMSSPATKAHSSAGPTAGQKDGQEPLTSRLTGVYPRDTTRDPLYAGVVLACAPLQAQSLRKAKATLNGCVDPTINVGNVFLVELPSAEAVKTVEVLISVRGL